MPFPTDLTIDKHDYLLFACPDCPRKAKLKRQAAVVLYRDETGMTPIIAGVRPNDCKSERCRFGLAVHKA